MIHNVFSTLSTFKRLDFARGLNVLVVDTTPESTSLQTRNRAGKSSLVELVHFLTGGNADPGSIFRSDALAQSTFGATLDLANQEVGVERSGARPSRVRLTRALVADGGELSPWPTELTNENWKAVLGESWFGLSREGDAPREPSFRSLFPYFARREASGGFLSPFKHFTQQSLGEQQVAISFLLGLDWTIPAALQQVRDQEGALRTLRQAAAAGAVPGGPRTTGELRSLIAVAQDRVDRAHRHIAEFRVLEEYEALQTEADDLTGLINDAADAVFADMRLRSRLTEALNSESPPQARVVAELYNEAGVALPGATVQRLEAVQQFHASIIANRRAYLEAELEAAEDRLRARQASMANWDGRRADILQLLSGHGALAQFSEIQAHVAQLDVDLAALRSEYSAAERVEGSRTDLELERVQLLRRLQQDFSERAAQLNHAIVTFEEISRALYEEAGRLEISESPNGPVFRVTIQGGQSRGVRNMQIFCMDLTIAKLCAERGLGPGFLIHDSHLFDGVDERQVGSAVGVAARLAEDLGIQYIVTMNSDVLPSTLPEGFDLQSHVLPVRLTDARDDGGLFGIRF